MNNTSFFTADRATHLKIVVVSLICATLLAGAGVASRLNDGATADSSNRMEATVIKIGKPVTASSTESSTIR